MSDTIQENKTAVKALLIGVILAIGITVILSAAAAFALGFSPSVPNSVLDCLTTAFAGIGVLIGGYTAAAVAKSKGLIMGLFCGVAVMLILLAVGLSQSENDISLLTAIKAAVLIICGILGGIKGVNRKEKVHIR